LVNVAKLAEQFAREARPGDDEFARAAHWTGLLHDLGKYTDEFQDRLEALATGRAAQRAVHAAYGAAYALERLHARDIALAVLGHHAGVSDARELTSKTRPFLNTEAVCAQKARADGAFLPETHHLCKFIAAKAWAEVDVWVRVLLSVVVDADRLDTARHRDNIVPKDSSLDADLFLSRVAAYITNRASTVNVDSVKQARRYVLERCLDAAAWPERLLSLTVPTGGGKTLSSLALALKRATLRPAEVRRIIVVIPFLSIIEQNADVFTEALGEGVVLEHHSGDTGRLHRRGRGEDARYILEEEKETPDSELERTRRLTVENWNAPVIVTTSVRFFESLFSNHPSDLRRVHRIARSLVILDEVQTLPRGLLRPLLSMMKTLSGQWGTHFLFCTATQPAFEKYPGAPGADLRWNPGTVREVIPDCAALFRNLTRVAVAWPSPREPWSLERVAFEMRKEGRALCVVNVKEHAATLFGLLRAHEQIGSPPPIFHLSTRMCAQHRLACIRKIARILQGDSEPCLVVSTQLVEAGVDLDFPVVFRAMAPLDAVAQAAGRCDREGRLTERGGGKPGGRVVVFETEDGKCPPGAYREGRDITRRLADMGDLNIYDPNRIRRYFHDFYNAPLDRNDVEALRKELKFAEVAQEFALIDDRTKAVFVPFDARAAEAIEMLLKKGDYDADLLRRLQRYQVGLYPGEFDEALKVGTIYQLWGGSDLWASRTSCYSPDLGLEIRPPDPGDLILNDRSGHERGPRNVGQE
jgi:CRISPR-associated endonuclease/helicase Cas3